MDSIIITGATSGIGYECALQMATIAPNEQIIIAARDKARGEATVAKIAARTGHRHIRFMQLDLASLRSIENFRDDIETEGIRISNLVNNAGSQSIGDRFTKDGFEETFGVNHLGTLYLTLLLSRSATNDARIVFTASGTHDPKQKTGMPAPAFKDAFRLAHPQASGASDMATGQRRYTTSKLCNILTVYELQKRLKNTNIHVNAFDPGLVPGTGLTRTYGPFLKFLADYVFKILILFHPNVHTARTSGSRLANLAYGKLYINAKGKYFEGEKEIRSSEDSYKESYQEELWRSSLDLLNVKQSDTIVPLH